MKLFKIYVIWGLLLILLGIVFDFTFVQGKVGQELVRSNPPSLTSWAKELYELTKFYMIVLGFLNITLALLICYFGSVTNLDEIVFGLIFVGSILLIVSGLWYANAGPSLKWELRCTVLTIGFISIVLGLGIEVYRFFSLKNFDSFTKSDKI